MNQEEVHINDITKLVEFVFVENRGNNRMLIESSDFKDNRDLFFFCIELTMKGLSYLYGNENGKVDIDDLSMEQIENIKSKLANAAIELLLDIEEIEDSVNDTEIIYDIPYNDLEKKVNLEEYSLKLIKKNTKYTLRFKIMDYF
jgi:hypothetical protein|tara:strand:+ start:503 stop:934 length:432 start_codon:yes stop_codon:yes gene_type:complete